MANVSGVLYLDRRMRNQIRHTQGIGGKVIYVDSTHSKANANNNGLTPDSPLTTIDAAYNKTTASSGDLVLVMPGHTETVAAAITMDKIGISILGIGNGRSRPAVTGLTGVSTISVSAASNSVAGLRLIGATGVLNHVALAAADFEMEDMVIEQGAGPTTGVTITTGAHRFSFRNCLWLGTADGPNFCIDMSSAADVADDWEIIDCKANFISGGGLDDAFLKSVNTTTGYHIKNLTLLGMDTAGLDFNSIVDSSYGADGLLEDVSIVPSASVGTIAALIDMGGSAAINCRVHNAQADTSGALIPATTAS